MKKGIVFVLLLYIFMVSAKAGSIGNTIQVLRLYDIIRLFRFLLLTYILSEPTPLIILEIFSALLA